MLMQWSVSVRRRQGRRQRATRTERQTEKQTQWQTERQSSGQWEAFLDFMLAMQMDTVVWRMERTSWLGHIPLEDFNAWFD
jgi:hypothetical protein